MTEKQKIEVGQVWQYIGRGETVTVVGTSPAWVRVQYEDDSEGSIRRGEFSEEKGLRGLRLKYEADTAVPTIAEVETPADPDFAEIANADEHACMKAAIVAFNAQTGLKLDESHGWLLLVNMHITSNCMGFDIDGYGRDMHDLYEESRK